MSMHSCSTNWAWMPAGGHFGKATGLCWSTRRGRARSAELHSAGPASGLSLEDSQPRSAAGAPQSATLQSYIPNGRILGKTYRVVHFFSADCARIKEKLNLNGATELMHEAIRR